MFVYLSGCHDNFLQVCAERAEIDIKYSGLHQIKLSIGLELWNVAKF